jgi:hypothetical protein
VGGWRRGFFFQAVFGVESRLFSVYLDSGLFMKVLFRRGGEGFVFLSANGRPKVPFFYSF